jgi:hypothetical protein
MSLLEDRYRQAMRRLKAAREAALELLDLDHDDQFVATQCNVNHGFRSIRDELREFAECSGLVREPGHSGGRPAS